MNGKLASPEQERLAIELFEQALDRPSQDREAFIAGAEVETESVRQRAAALLDYSQSGPSSFVTGQAGQDFNEDEALPDTIGAYRILRLIGRGGMGNVYLAERASDDFDHVAAIKVIKRTLVTDEVIDRFRRERQILAGLNHPHIARLFDGGEAENGAPYIVMEYVAGKPLHHWIEEAKPDKAHVLDVFCQVCEAVGFAHQNLVVHRDLTPPNILIDEEGRAKLIDFGISRPDGDDGTTAPSTTGFTPGFAAPERQTGDAANVLSDVFSLGKLLRLITERWTDPELQAIITKATASDPANRYASVASLQAEIEAYRSGEPVTAFSSSPFYLARKFASRQKLLVGATATLGTALIAALIGLTFAYQGQVEAQAKAAERADDTRAIASSMMFDVYDEVASIPGSTEARVALAQTAQKYLRSLADDPDATIETRLDAGNGFRRLAKIIGGTQTNAAGDISSGIEYLEESREILSALHEDAPNQPEVTTGYAETLTELAFEKLLAEGNAEEALGYADQAIALLRSRQKLDADAAAALILAYRYKGDALSWEEKLDASAKSFKVALERIETLPSKTAQSAQVLRAEAELLQTYAGFLATFRENPEGAADFFQDSVQLRRTVVGKPGSGPDDEYKLVIALYYLGAVQHRLGRLDDAKRSASEAMELASEQRKLNPSSATQGSLYAGILMLNAVVDSETGGSEKGATMAKEAIVLMRERLAQNPDVASAKMNLAVRLHQAGIVYDSAGLKNEACNAMREGAGYMREFDRKVGLPQGNRDDQYRPMLQYLESC